jgi:hypothetical protein
VLLDWGLHLKISTNSQTTPFGVVSIAVYSIKIWLHQQLFLSYRQSLNVIILSPLLYIHYKKNNRSGRTFFTPVILYSINTVQVLLWYCTHYTSTAAIHQGVPAMECASNPNFRDELSSFITVTQPLLSLSYNQLTLHSFITETQFEEISFLYLKCKLRIGYA